MDRITAYKLLHKGTLAFARAERQGIRINIEYCKKKKQHLARKINRSEEKFKLSKFYRHWMHSTGNRINIHSPPQLSHFLYNIKKLEPPYLTKTGKGAADEEALKMLNIPELNQLLEIRKLLKIKDTYLEGFIKEQVNGYIHPSFNLHLVRTFRSSSNAPNFQNIPKRDIEAMNTVRKALFPRPGHQLMEVDFSSLEVRIAACYHQDPTMLKYLRDPSTDMHRDMAQQIFIMDKIDKRIPSNKVLRDIAKGAFVFAQFYGDYYKNCAKNIAQRYCQLPDKKWKKGRGLKIPGGYLSDHLIDKGIKSMADFTEHIKQIEDHFWSERFPVYQNWKERWWRNYQKKGYIEMFTGFRCSGIMKRNDAINYPVQGAAFHCLLWCFIQLDQIIQKEKLKTRLIGQVHDSIVIDLYPSELDKIALEVQSVLTRDLPRHWTWINVPLEVEADLGAVDKSWADLKPYELPK